MTELIQKLFLAEHRSAIDELASEIESIVTLANQIKDCDTLESLRDHLKEIAQEAHSTMQGMERDFNIED